jgi:hypothetical protein
MAVLAAACDQVADGPQPHAGARADRDWMVEFLLRAKRTVSGSTSTSLSPGA